MAVLDAVQAPRIDKLPIEGCRTTVSAEVGNENQGQRSDGVRGRTIRTRHVAIPIPLVGLGLAIGVLPLVGFIALGAVRLLRAALADDLVLDLKRTLKQSYEVDHVVGRDQDDRGAPRRA